MIAYRAFKLHPSGALHSPFAQHLWTREGNRAECGFLTQKNVNKAGGRLHAADAPCPSAPDPSCLCGFYGFPAARLEAGIAGQATPVAADNVIGLVSAYGRVITHTDGVIRAEYMTILALMVFRFGAVSDDLYDFYSALPPPSGAAILAAKDALARLAAVWDVPLLVCEDLTAGLAFLAEEAHKHREQYDESEAA